MTEADLERRVRRSDLDAAAAGAATGAEFTDADKTEGIPNYLLRFSGTVNRLAEPQGGASAVTDDGVAYELGREVRLLTTDVIDMVQQQGGAAEKVDYLRGTEDFDQPVHDESGVRDAAAAEARDVCKRAR